MTQRTLRIWKTAFAAALVLTSCKTTRPIPVWSGKLYAGDSSQAALVRKQDNEVIPANDPRFDEFLGMTYADFESFYATYVMGCEKWRSDVPKMSPAQMSRLFQEYLAIKTGR